MIKPFDVYQHIWDYLQDGLEELKREKPGNLNVGFKINIEDAIECINLDMAHTLDQEHDGRAKWFRKKCIKLLKKFEKSYKEKLQKTNREQTNKKRLRATWLV